MPNRIINLFIFILLIFAVIPLYKVKAADSSSTCDLCGWCNRFAPTPYPEPENWEDCMNCIYKDGITGNEPEPNAYFTVFGCLSTKPGEFVKKLLSLSFGIVGGTAFIAVLGGSGLVLTSGGDPERLRTGKNIISSSIIGLLLVLFSAFLLRLVGYDILRIPGFG